MKALPIFIALVLALSLNSQAQKKSGKTLVTINNNTITDTEFERVYQKNNQIGTAEKESVNEYFDLFVKFKLKVAAAIDMGLDTLPSFKNELKGYKEQLAKNYMTDTVKLNQLIKEGYERTKMVVRLGHIMVALQNNPSPTDTLAAWNKLMAIKARLDKGENFETVALETSEDPSVKINKGVLGSFSSFRVPYSFESMAFNTPVGSVSNPVRTQYGFHLIKVFDKKPSPGEVKVAHIMVLCPEDNSELNKSRAKQKIDSIYNRLQQGESFDTLAFKCSEDQYTAKNYGALDWFGPGMMVLPFEDAAFALKNKGDFSKPIQTRFGYHIIKLIDAKPVPDFDKMKGDLKDRVSKNERNEEIQKCFVNNLKQQYNPVLNKKVILGLYNLDTMIYKKETNLMTVCDTNAIFLTIGKKNYKVKQLDDMLNANRNSYQKWSARDFIDHTIQDFVSKNIVQYENEQLENKYPEYANLSKEYYEGILLFNVMEKMVWGKASSDTTGLENFYEKNKDKYNNPEPKALKDIKGIVISDYQNYLEKNWIAELREKYPVVVNQKLLNKLADKYKVK
jgi:peptidyl-prolyl cis-trans isomerase SurA